MPRAGWWASQPSWNHSWQVHSRMKPHRSLLFVPGNRQRMLEKAPTTDADALVFDLEDSVPVDDKQLARTMVSGALAGVMRPEAFIRVNGVASGETLRDLEATVCPTLRGVLLPKVQGPGDVATVSAWLDDLESTSGDHGHRIELVCMIETAGGLRLAYEIASASPRVASLLCSSAENGDLQTDLDCEWTPDGASMLYARSKIISDARAAGIPHALDGVYARVGDIAGLIRDTELSRRLGYNGRTVIHPDHIAPVNRIYSPTPDAVAYSRGLIDAFEAAVADGKASIAYEGRMVDYAMVVWARRVLTRAAVSGSEAPTT